MWVVVLGNIPKKNFDFGSNLEVLNCLPTLPWFFCGVVFSKVLIGTTDSGAA